ncbi:phosphoenolpyruvate--protein phosphotransferase [Acetonema longum]|uniref:Phosphoenolpyruvate-protein phosphotransferase n=1 Tax=Acetonema longum DSM 6540 TaxID=1009370 RepID=F7NJQ0_9FIRM|nr:phosphoenolpyruvate--protein phosphotransferase [Acetonema longum]EGO63706.1 phosphoenolpyruvate--protein phosphotransferase [Acetonema longum DSM 6540]
MAVAAIKNRWQGIGASAGLALAKVWVMEPPASQNEFSIEAEGPVDFTAEQHRLAEAVEKTRQALLALEAQVKNEQGEKVAQIFAAHAALLDDPAFIGEARSRIASFSITARKAVTDVTAESVAMLESLDDEYFRERATDVKDVARQILEHLTGSKGQAHFPAIGDYIVVAPELTPAQTIALPKDRVAGFIVQKGGKTSHAAILARTYGIPAVIGLSQSWQELAGLFAARLDGEEGWVEPVEAAEYALQAGKNEGLQAVEDKAGEDSPWLKQFVLAANIGSPTDLPFVEKFQGQGIGLYRTEFLFMGNTLPSEEEQTEAYRQVIAACSPHLTIIRTLDIGGDKQAPALNLPRESNPFLGVRALRLCFERPELLMTQLRAIWRASAAGPAAVMFPMIAAREELRQAKDYLEQARQAVLTNGYPVGSLQVGIMIEIPSAAWIADKLAEEVDFFSIGTNDLTQYTLAVDRENSALASLNQPYHPAVLGLIARVSQAAKARGVWTGICGEAGGDPLLPPFFAALGIDELSMAPGQLPKVRRKLAGLPFAPGEADSLVSRILDCATHDEVKAILQNY